MRLQPENSNSKGGTNVSNGNPGSTGGSGLAPNVAAGLAYLFGIIGGIIFVVIEKTDPFVRFSAMQSILLTAAYFVVRIAYAILLGIFAAIPGVRIVVAFPGVLIGTLIGLGFLVLWILMVIKTFAGEKVVLPVIGEMAERYSQSV